MTGEREGKEEKRRKKKKKGNKFGTRQSHVSEGGLRAGLVVVSTELSSTRLQLLQL